MARGRRHKVPVGVRHCVAQVAPKYGGDTQKAFAICVASQQKSGRLKKGTMKPTKLGRKVAKRKYADKGHKAKDAAYDELLKSSRKEGMKRFGPRALALVGLIDEAMKGVEP